MIQKIGLKLVYDFEVKGNTLFFFNDNADNLITDVKKIIRSKRYDFLKLVDFLNKSEVRFIKKQDRRECKDKIKVIYRNRKNYEFIQTKNLLDTLNFSELSVFILNQEDVEKKNDYKTSLEKAYIMCYIGDYYNSYKTYKQISEIALKNKEFLIYALSEFNRYYVGKLVRNRFKYGKTITEKVEKEIEKIELDKILLRFPFNPVEHEFIKSIISWNFVNSNKMLNIKQKMDKDENTCYTWIAKDSTGIYQFQNYIEKFWKFIKYNLLSIDKYNEIRGIFYNYIDSILKSYSIPKVYLSEEFSILGEKSENIKIEELSAFDLKCIVEYLGYKDLENILQRYEISELKVKEDEFDNFITIIKNTIDFLKKDDKYNFNIQINTIFLLLSVIKFNSQQYENINNYILEYLNSRTLSINEYRYLNKYLYYQWENFKNFELNSLVNILLNILENLKAFKDIFDSQINIIHNLTSYIYINCKDFKLNNENLIYSLINNSSNNMYIILTELYRILNIKEKTKIRNAIKSKLNINEYEMFHGEIYYKSLTSKIIKPKSEYEVKYFELIEKIEDEEDEYFKSYPNQLEIILGWTSNLILNNYILDKGKFNKFLGIMDDYDFLYDINKFPVNKFKIEWLNKFSESLIIKISQHDNIKLEIKRKIEKMILEGNKIDNKLLKIYIKYFN